MNTETEDKRSPLDKAVERLRLVAEGKLTVDEWIAGCTDEMVFAVADLESEHILEKLLNKVSEKA